MKKFLLMLCFLFICSSAMAAAPNIEESTYMQFTAADQETTMSFKIYTITWTSFTGSVIVDTNILNLEDGAGVEVLKLTADANNTSFVVNFPQGLYVKGLKAEDLTKGYVHVYGKRR